MSELAVIKGLALATTTALELITAINRAATIMNARHERGGDYTEEEKAAIDEALQLSKLSRDAAIEKA